MKRVHKRYLKERDWLERPSREQEAKEMLKKGASVLDVSQKTGLSLVWIEAQKKKMRGGL